MNSTSNDGERIAKALSRRGVASRRDAERMILDGRVSVNGKVVTSPALNVTATDRLAVDGSLVPEPEPTRLWLYHKPPGLVTSDQDEQGRATIYDGLPEGMPRVMSVGRLDLTSEGLLLLTNDGAIKRRLELPETGWLRRYRVRIKGAVSEAQLDRLRAGITVEDVHYQPMEVTFDRQQGANAWLTVALREGKNREIRRVMEALGVTVNRLIRVSYGPFQLGKLAAGEVEEIPRRQVRDQLGLDGARPQIQRSRKPMGGKPGVGKGGEGKGGGGRPGPAAEADDGRPPRAAGSRSVRAAASQDQSTRARAPHPGGPPRARPVEATGAARPAPKSRAPKPRPLVPDRAAREDRPRGAAGATGTERGPRPTDKPARWTKERRTSGSAVAGPSDSRGGKPGGRSDSAGRGAREAGKGGAAAGRSWSSRTTAQTYDGPKGPRPARGEGPAREGHRSEPRGGEKTGGRSGAGSYASKTGAKAGAKAGARTGTRSHGPDGKPPHKGPPRSDSRPAGKPTGKATGKATGKPGGKPGGRPTGKLAGKPGAPPRGRKPRG